MKDDNMRTQDGTAFVTHSVTLGVDAEGYTHHYYKPSETVVRYDDTGVERRVDVSGRTLAEYMEFVAQVGWRVRGPHAQFAVQKRDQDMEVCA